MDKAKSSESRLNNDENDWKIDFDNLTTPSLLAEKIQNEVDKIIEDCPNVDWNENFLSYQVVRTLRNILSCYKIPKIDNIFSNSKFDLEAYKLTGKPEEFHGDIAIIVSRILPFHKSPISGVGFYEAKASSLDRGGDWFPSFSIQQLRRLVSKTPRLTYLLYNKRARIVGVDEWATPDFGKYNNYQHNLQRNDDLKKAFAYTIDANYLKQCRNINLATDSYGQSFGYHFTYKILSGRELDYSRPVEQTIRLWLKNTRRATPLIISISVHEKNEDINFSQVALPGFTKIKISDNNR